MLVSGEFKLQADGLDDRLQSRKRLNIRVARDMFIWTSSCLVWSTTTFLYLHLCQKVESLED